jgi:hypothetical protein
MTEAELIAEEIQKYNNPCGRAAMVDHPTSEYHPL